MSYDGMMLKSVVEELNKHLLSSRVDKIHLPTHHELFMSFRKTQVNETLLISVSSNHPRMYLTKNKLENPMQPPLFCMVLRKHLQGSKLIQVKQIGQDRIAEFVFEGYNELGDSVKLSLIVEIMGKYSNIILIDTDSRRIIDCLTKVGSSMSSVREVLPGKIYSSDVINQKKSILDESYQDFVKAYLESPENKTFQQFLITSYMGISKTLTREINFRAGLDEALPKSALDSEDQEKLLNLAYDFFQKVKKKNYLFAIYEDLEDEKILDFSNLPLTMYGSGSQVYDSPSELLENVYTQRAEKDLIQQKSADLRKNLKIQLNRDYSKLGKLRNELDAAQNREKYKVYGDLISANLHAIEAGQKELLAENFYDPDLKTIKIPLDIKLSPAQNANKMYKRYQKLKHAASILKDQIQETLEKIQAYEEISLQIDWAENPRDLDEIKDSYRLISGQKSRKNKKNKNKSSNPMVFQSKTAMIYVGKNNRQNDEITFKIANKDDLWFHIRNNPGSHVLLKSNGQEFKNEDMLAAAGLAAYFSKLRGSKHVDVDYTLKKYIKRHPSNKLGLVHYTNFKTVHVSGQNIPKSLTRQS